MRFLDEYRRRDEVHQMARVIHRLATRPWTLMEVCGGQTHTIVKSGLQDLLPEHVTLVHGPGCPVCVTPLEMIDRAIAIATRPNVIFCSFGDMLRVPGSSQSLFDAKALELLRSQPVSAGATCIGTVQKTPTKLVTLQSRIGGTRVLDMISGEQLPRIC